MGIVILWFLNSVPRLLFPVASRPTFLIFIELPHFALSLTRDLRVGVHMTWLLCAPRARARRCEMKPHRRGRFVSFALTPVRAHVLYLNQMRPKILAYFALLPVLRSWVVRELADLAF